MGWLKQARLPNTKNTNIEAEASCGTVVVNKITGTREDVRPWFHLPSKSRPKVLPWMDKSCTTLGYRFWWGPYRFTAFLRPTCAALFFLNQGTNFFSFVYFSRELNPPNQKSGRERAPSWLGPRRESPSRILTGATWTSQRPT